MNEQIVLINDLLRKFADQQHKSNAAYLVFATQTEQWLGSVAQQPFIVLGHHIVSAPFISSLLAQ